MFNMFDIYNYNQYSSVVSVLDKAEEAVNSYSYDPFGRVIAASESVQNILQCHFLSWMVTTSSVLKGLVSPGMMQ